MKLAPKTKPEESTTTAKPSAAKKAAPKAKTSAKEVRTTVLYAPSVRYLLLIGVPLP